MNILVTGGSGFLGSHVADALSAAGHAVTILDRSPSPWLGDGQSMLCGDILDAGLLAEAVHSMDAVYHFAAIADIDDCAARPVETAETNILGTVRLLDACARQGSIERFVFASSAYVYSDAGLFYRTSKMACEQFIEDFHERYGLSYTCLRYGSLYGDRADRHNSIHRLLTSALRDGRMEYSGTGEEVREFIHVRDAAAISVDILAPDHANCHVMLTGMEKMRYLDLLNMIREMLGGRVEIVVTPSDRKAHYTLTPYNFSPRLGRKVVRNAFIDMGQGLLDCMASIHRDLYGEDDSGLGLMARKDGRP